MSEKELREVSLPQHIKRSLAQAECLRGYDEPTNVVIQKPSTPTHLFSFCTTNWQKARQRFDIQQTFVARHGGYFSSYQQPDELALDEDFLKRASAIQDGSKYFYFQAWKPYLLALRLQQLPVGDRVVYIDAGCTLPPPDALQTFFDGLSSVFDRMTHDGSMFALPINPDYTYCCASDCCLSLLRFFRLIRSRRFLYGFPHYEDGVMLMVNDDRTRLFVSEWSETMLKHLPELFSDPKHGTEGFAQNSQDQAVLQAMLYKKKIGVTDITNLAYGSGLYARIRG